ncbi:uncharacterized protein [Chironomus tepperi]|uniref:uncharacterized protein n=1 Tax=Chironomus tepperi TaxID=113505 RepID=UPI00391F6FE7
MAVVAKNAATKTPKAKWLKDFIRILKLDFRFGDNRSTESVVNKPTKIQRLFVIPSNIPDPPVVLPEEWTSVQNNRSNQGLGSVRRNNEIFTTTSNPPPERQ